MRVSRVIILALGTLLMVSGCSHGSEVLTADRCHSETIQWCKDQGQRMVYDTERKIMIHNPMPLETCIANNAHWCDDCERIYNDDPHSDEGTNCKQWLDGTVFKELKDVDKK